ncbi:MAG: winged helix-turn-helix domain-containing protein [Candidatus Thermoplasmatota archaeon]|nr:winged helix-turn-helix domain-containing protein [Candidatus Thermoplasmatota archaeon]
MNQNYSIAILNRDGKHIMRPFFVDIPKISKLVVIAGPKSDNEDATYEVTNFLKSINVKFEFIRINDIENFLEIFLVIQKICKNEGLPTWVNVSCGSGIGVSALTIHACSRIIPLVVYDDLSNKTAVIDVKRIKSMNIYDQIFENIINSLSAGNKTMNELARDMNLEKSTISRRMKKLISFGLIVRKGSGSRNSPYTHMLSEFGKLMLL